MENNPQPAPWPPEQPTAPPPPQPQPAAPQPVQSASPEVAAQPPPDPASANQYVPDGMSSYDYLDTIASTPNKVLGFTPKQLLIAAIGLIFVLGFFVIAWVINGAGPNTTQQKYTLLARSGALAEAAKESQPNIKSRDLSPLNSSLATQLKTTESGLKKILTDSGLNVKKIPKDILAAEDNQKLLDKLDDARLSGTFDRVYTREMTYHLQTLILALDSLHATTKDTALKDDLSSLSGNLAALHKQLAAYVDD